MSRIRGYSLSLRASLCGGFSCCDALALGAWAFGSYGSRALECELSNCDAQALVALQARGIVPDQGSNLCPLHWQADS